MSPQLTAAIPGNSDSIPVGDLAVRETGTSAFDPLSNVTSLVVHSQSGPSAAGGDAVSNDYQAAIPFVASDTYSGTLEYIAITQ
jgi:large repetitive protein